WGPRAIGDHGAPVSLPKLKKAYEKVVAALNDRSPPASFKPHKWARNHESHMVITRGGLTTHGAPGQ
ncbi:unnamed protein product, partial [Staurois parvus]